MQIFEEVVGVCEDAFEESEPASAVVATSFGLAEADVRSALWGCDTCGFERCLAAGRAQVAEDPVYAKAVGDASVQSLVRWVEKVLAKLSIAHQESVDGHGNSEFLLEIDGYRVSLSVLKEGGVRVRTFDCKALPKDSKAQAFADSVNSRYAHLGMIKFCSDRLVYDVKPHLPTLLENAEQEMSTAVVYGARIFRLLERAVDLIRVGLSPLAAMQMIPSAFPQK